MGDLRRFLNDRRWLAAALVIAALCIKALVPGGYMLAPHGKILTVQICADASGETSTRQIVLPQKPAPDDGQDAHGKSDGHCPYAALSLVALSGADAALLALAIAFILALGFAALRSFAPRPYHRLRPPLRGPPTYA